MKKLVTVILGHIIFFLCAVAILFFFSSMKLATYQNQVMIQIAACMTAAALIMTILCAICGRSKKKNQKATSGNETAAQEQGTAAPD